MIRPSTLTRNFACPPSAILAERVPDQPSKYADEGTAAHELAEFCIRLGMSPKTFHGLGIADQTLTDELAEAVQVYLEHIAGISMPADAQEWIEFRIDSEILGIGGTIDYLTVAGNIARIVDLKYGVGVPVDAATSDQLKAYACLVAERFPDVDVIEADIVQPRSAKGQPISSVFFKRKELDQFATRIIDLRGRVDYLRRMEKSTDDLDAFHTGDHCQFCPAKSICPAIAAESTALVELSATSTLTTIDAEKLAWILEHEKQVTQFIAEAKHEAKSRLKSGESVPGYKLVETLSNRRWTKDVEEIEATLRRKKFKKSDITKTQLLSPAQLEKVCGKELINSLTTREVTGSSVVSESDRRPAISSDPQSEFERIEPCQ